MRDYRHFGTAGASHSAGATEKDPVGKSHILALIIVVFMTGGILPSIGGTSLTLLATPVVALAIVMVTFGRTDTLARTWPILAMLFTILVSAYLGPASENSYGEEKLNAFVSATLLSALAGTLIVSKNALCNLAKGWVLVSLVLSVSVLALGEDWGGGRGTVFEANPIWLGRALALGVCFSVSLPRMGARNFWGWAPLLILPAMFVTGARAPLAAAAIGVLILVLRDAGRVVMASAFLAVAYYAVLNIPALSGTRIGRALRGNEGPDAVTDGGRFDMWEETVALWRREPGGVGIGNWSEHVDIGDFLYPHNLWLEVASELGTVTFSMIVLLLVAGCVWLFRAPIDETAQRLLLACLAAEAIGVTTSGDLNARTFFFVMAMCFSARTWGPASARFQGVGSTKVSAGGGSS